MWFRRTVQDGEDYERYVADLLRREGYRDIQLTARTGDYGVDLLATRGRNRYAVQCKYYTGAVGGAAVQEAVAGMAYYGCERALVVTNSYLTPAAHNLARANGVGVLEHIDPESLSFLERREPWQLALLTAGLVAFLLGLSRMLEQGSFTWPGCGWLALLCFPLPFLAAWLLRLLWRHRRGRPEEEPSDSETE